MAPSWFLPFAVALSCFFGLLRGSPGDANSVYQACVQQCEKTGCVGNKCFQHCNFYSNENSTDGPWYLQEPLYVQWKQWDCLSDCRYHCMLSREEERHKLGHRPEKYHGKWPIERMYGIQEPVSVALSALNLAVQFHGWVSFFILVNYKLPFTPKKKTYYDYTGMWHVYAIFAMNYWFWTAVFLSRDVELTEKLHYSSAVALHGYSLFLALIRAFRVRVEAIRVMVAAPVFGILTTHILYMNFYEFDYGWNAMVCVVISALQIAVWAAWAAQARHPQRWKLWVVVFGGAVSMLVKLYDFPPWWALLDARGLWHATMIPLTYLWWSFVKDDSVWMTSLVINKNK
ncbi:post-GPI attachment to proteins factor 3-like [Salvia divinorum]|uniref:Post-GPI attachment to proteins factor 3 n=1 Tax=Salvia divinorum TaxID=28513 RepID=A0ABD1IE57_SALDI